MASDSSNGPVSKALTSTLIASLVCLLSFSFREDADGQAQGQDAFVHATVEQGQTSSPAFAQPDEPVVTDLVLSELLLQEAILAFDSREYATALQILDTFPATPATEYYRGLCLLRMGDAPAASRVLTQIQSDSGKPEELRLDTSIALLKSGQPEAATTELNNLLTGSPENGQARYFLGLALFEQGENEAALEHIEVAAQFDETLEPYRDAFRAYDQRLGAAALGSYQPLRLSESEPRRWNLSFLTGFEYDSNVPLTPVFSGLGGNIEKEDSRWVVGLFGDYRLVQEEDEVLGVTASAYTNFHFDLDQFDVQNYATSAYYNWADGDWITGVTYSFGETVLAGSQFATSHRLTASRTKRWGDSGHSTAFYEYEFLDLAGLTLIPAQNRTGHTNSVGFTQAWYIGPQNLGRIYAGYRFDHTNAYGNDFDMSSHMVNARVEYPIFQDLVVDAEARQFWDEYSNDNSLDFFERSREDQRLELRAGIQKYINQNTSLRFDYTYVDSDSNVANLFGVDFYSYQKHVLSALLIYDF